MMDFLFAAMSPCGGIARSLRDVAALTPCLLLSRAIKFPVRETHTGAYALNVIAIRRGGLAAA